MLGLLSYALKQVIIELCQEKSSNHEKHGWNFYSQAVFLQPHAKQQFFGGGKLSLENVFHQLAKNVFLRAEVMHHGVDVDPRCRCDLPHGGRFVALFQKHSRRRIQHKLAILQSFLFVSVCRQSTSPLL